MQGTQLSTVQCSACMVFRILYGVQIIRHRQTGAAGQGAEHIYVDAEDMEQLEGAADHVPLCEGLAVGLLDPPIYQIVIAGNHGFWGGTGGAGGVQDQPVVLGTRLIPGLAEALGLFPAHLNQLFQGEAGAAVHAADVKYGL